MDREHRNMDLDTRNIQLEEKQWLLCMTEQSGDV